MYQSQTLSQSSTAPFFWLQRIIRPLPRPGKRWRGGIRLTGHKAISNGTPIRQLSPHDSVLSIPLGTSRNQAIPCVTPGQRVRKGEPIAVGEGFTPWVHASTSGRVVAIQATHLADQETMVPAIQIAADGLDEWLERRPTLPPQSADALAKFAAQMGLVGLGGAGFPTGIKISGAQQPDLLLVNGAECEPFITCDDRLMRERAGDIIRAADYVARTLRIEQVRIGLEPNKAEAISALKEAAARLASNVAIHQVPQRYPAGGQPMLIRSLSGRTLAPGMLPAEVGVMVLNVATLYALGRAVFQHEPLVSRIVTLTGHVDNPGNVEVPIGMPVAGLLAHASPRAEHDGVHVGGPMMGRLLTQQTAVISKTSSCLIARSADLFPPRAEARDCIRCNRCVDVCPMALQPLQLYSASQRADVTHLQQERLSACIECAACSQVCPSNLPLRDSFRAAKQMIVRSSMQ